jgi:hypothetical protein
MRMFDVQGIEIRAQRANVFEFLRNPGNLPHWPMHSRRSRMAGPGSRRLQDPWKYSRV